METRYNAKLYIKWSVEESYCLHENENITRKQLKEIEDYMEDIIYNGYAVDAQLEYSISTND